MKPAILVFIAIVALSYTVRAQGERTIASAQSMIRQYEQEEVLALVNGDRDRIRAHWADDFVVNNPFNQIVDASKGPIQAGTLVYSTFERQIERIVEHGNTIVVMGNERVVPKAPSPDAGKTINRRFTNIWLKRNGRWLLTARHANVTCSN